MNKRLYVILDFGDGIICSMDALGSREQIEIDGLSGILELPGPPDWSGAPKDPLRVLLKPPADAASWKRGGDPINWGRPTSYPSGVSEVNAGLLIFDLEKSRLRELSTRIYRNVGAWERSFLEYLELITKQKRIRTVVVHDGGGHRDVFCMPESGPVIRPYEIEPNRITVVVQGDGIALSKGQLGRICMLLAKGVELPVEYQLQLEAYRALARGDHRKAIIETAVSAEISLTEAVRAKLKGSGIGYGDQLIDKFRMLGGRLELARMVGVDLPSLDVKTLLVEPRNNVIHRADFSNERLALGAIEATDAILDKLSGLQ